MKQSNGDLTPKHVKISIIIPIHNEEIILEKEAKSMFSKFKEVLPHIIFEIFLVENGSKDNTLAIAKNLKKSNIHIRVDSLHSAGYGNALKHGILKSKGEFIAIFNIDLWDIDFIKTSLRHLEDNGFDFVIGSKTMLGANDKRPLLRQLITRSFNIFLRLLFDFSGTDTHGIKVLRRRKILKVVKQCQTFREIFDTELILRSQYAGLKIKELPVTVEEKRKSTYGILGRIPRTIKDLIILKQTLK